MSCQSGTKVAFHPSAQVKVGFWWIWSACAKRPELAVPSIPHDDHARTELPHVGLGPRPASQSSTYVRDRQAKCFGGQRQPALMTLVPNQLGGGGKLVKKSPSMAIPNPCTIFENCLKWSLKKKTIKDYVFCSAFSVFFWPAFLLFPLLSSFCLSFLPFSSLSSPFFFFSSPSLFFTHIMRLVMIYWFCIRGSLSAS